MALQLMSLWLQPEQAAAAELDTEIARVAAVHDTAAFASHLTVLGPVEQEVTVAIAALDRLASQLSPLDVTFLQTRCEDAWQRSLYLAAVADSALRRAFECAARVFAVSTPAFEPHLSLQYSQLPVADKVRLAAELTLQMPRRVLFTRLSLWQTAGSDASRWRLLATRSLDG
ncbi:MAG: hypothetical protein ABIQ09_05590 [Jatrophihabitantaceae bacterium]